MIIVKNFQTFLRLLRVFELLKEAFKSAYCFYVMFQYIISTKETVICKLQSTLCEQRLSVLLCSSPDELSE